MTQESRITKDWLRGRIEAEPDDCEIEAGWPGPREEAALNARLRARVSDPTRALANINEAMWREAEKECDALKAALREAVEREQERCAAIADAEAAEAYRNPRAANYRNPEQEKMARYTAERIAKLIRAGRPAPVSGEGD